MEDHRGFRVSARVIAPLVVATNQDGKLLYHYHGAVIPWLSEEERARFVADGLVEDLGDIGTPGGEAFIPLDPSTDAGTSGDGGGSELARPENTALKEVWVEYAVSTGFNREEANAMNKGDLIAALS